ncbi:hypothetical protein [Pseudomonas sp. MPR-ANC1]|uniref:hypothetical protein n=1 Tax=Pseudomonas sp. MPR-ANC1 TaxID=2075548 RepID=UPI0011AF80CC|nr:hypothetical protein [Pseudomonas sp. MPR-ANC1]
MLKPMLDAHSIESITLTCEYDGDVSSVGLSVIKEEASRLKLKYQNRRIARRPVNQGDSFSSEAADILGYSFLSKDSERDISKFDIINENALVTSFAYTSFKAFLADVSFSLSVAHRAFLLSERKLDKIVLSYRNSFIADSADEIHKAIRSSSPYIANVCLSKVNFWHSRIGFFSNEPLQYPLFLHNVEATHKLLKVEEGSFEEDAKNIHQLQIDTHHVMNINIPVGVEEFGHLIEARSTDLRDKHLQILRGIITDEVAGLINLSME